MHFKNRPFRMARQFVVILYRHLPRGVHFRFDRNGERFHQ